MPQVEPAQSCAHRDHEKGPWVGAKSSSESCCCSMQQRGRFCCSICTARFAHTISSVLKQSSSMASECWLGCWETKGVGMLHGEPEMGAFELRM